MKTITAATVKNAIRSYDEGDRPYRFTKSRSWYLVGEKGLIYPLKYIYALATNQTPSSFNTSESRREFDRLGLDLKQYPKDFETEFLRRVEKSLKDSSAQRKERLKRAPRVPRPSIREVVAYNRNPDVVAEVLANANGICEDCKSPAPFYKKSNDQPYLEVHHIKQLADGGEDTVSNAIAVCPNCHREAHYGYPIIPPDVAR